MEDFVTWVDSSKIKQHVMNYNEEVRTKLDLNLNLQQGRYYGSILSCSECK